MESLIDKIDVLSGRILEPSAPDLSLDETKVAVTELVKPLYRALVKTKQDNIIHGQQYGLFSFTPARGATPDKYGVYGTAKLRGNFATVESANDAAELIIRTTDSQNEIYTVHVGQSFPLTRDIKFTKEFETVNLDKVVDEVEKHQKQQQAIKEQKERKLIVDREQQLLNENKEILEGTFEEDPLDVYIRACVKRSQLKWTLEDTMRRVEKEIKPALQKAEDEVKALNEKDPTLRKRYMTKYIEARKSAGIETDFEEKGTQQDFVKYLMDE